MQSTITLMGLKLISLSMVLVRMDAHGCYPSLNHSRQIVPQQPTNRKPIARHKTRFSLPGVLK